MELEDVLTAGQIGQLDGDAAVKTTGAQQGRIKLSGRLVAARTTILVVIEAVHLGQQLVERLLTLIVAAKATAIALLADGIDLVDEHDTRGLFLGLLKQIAHLGGAAADEHLNKLRTRNTKERHARLAGNGLGKQGLTGTRRADKKSTARQLGADFLVALRLLQKVDDLLEGLLGLFLAGDILKGHATSLEAITRAPDLPSPPPPKPPPPKFIDGPSSPMAFFMRRLSHQPIRKKMAMGRMRVSR